MLAIRLLAVLSIRSWMTFKTCRQFINWAAFRLKREHWGATCLADWLEVMLTDVTCILLRCIFQLFQGGVLDPE
ncbi:hypothetical protein A0H81_12074 [Grifola frondosa]|uniref:Uncharacterized protein n=1 Tax=Grifola frondosa TaxID=5627 RepID=A0A1C7LS36_GRIFR|nr:hypothetical protein A0H81_12074 [Grifola frondosa]